MTKIRNYQAGDEPVPGYRLTASLGSGGFGEVWKASAPGGTQVAIKIINLGMKGALKEFRSLRLVKKIQYPSLVPILAIWLKDADGNFLEEAAFDDASESSRNVPAGTLNVDTIALTRPSAAAELIIAMGLAQKSLADRLEECRQQGLSGIPVDELLNYLQDAARAIDYLNSARHNLGAGGEAIQHCDIKPPNILLVGDAAQVCDFSLARVVDDTRKTSVAITPYYAAPEIIETNVPSATTDQYSLAVSYVELRTGQLPFPQDATLHKVMHAHTTGNLDLSRLSTAERDVIKKATAVWPADRFKSCSEMVGALRMAQQAVTPRSPWKAALRWAALAMVPLLVAALVVALNGNGGTSTPPPGPETWLPSGFREAPGAKRIVVHGRNLWDRILCMQHGLDIPFRLIDRRGRTDGPEPFYLMENKVSNEQFARFVESDSKWHGIQDWKQGGKANLKNLGVSGHETLPVFRVNWVEAAAFARWLGGQLPTVEQWEAAAGRFANSHADGPFASPWTAGDPTQIAVGRGISGPLPVGTASRDVSIYGCRDMAGNGLEWTSTLTNSLNRLPEIDPAIEPDERVQVRLCGRDYIKPTPLSFAEMADTLKYESARCKDRRWVIGFRVALKATGN